MSASIELADVQTLRLERGEQIRIGLTDAEASIPTSPTDGENYETETRELESIEATVDEVRISSTREGNKTVVGWLDVDPDEWTRIGLDEQLDPTEHEHVHTVADPERRLIIKGESHPGDDAPDVSLRCRVARLRARHMRLDVHDPGYTGRDHRLGDVAAIERLESDGSDRS